MKSVDDWLLLEGSLFMLTRKAKELAMPQSEEREFHTQIRAGTKAYAGGGPAGNHLRQRQCKHEQPEMMRGMRPRD